MHVNYLTSFEVLVIKMADDELTAGNIRQEFLLSNLSVFPVTFDEILLFLLVDIFHLVHPSFSNVSHYLFLLLITKVVLIVLVVIMMMSVQQVALS